LAENYLPGLIEIYLSKKCINYNLCNHLKRKLYFNRKFALTCLSIENKMVDVELNIPTQGELKVSKNLIISAGLSAALLFTANVFADDATTSMPTSSATSAFRPYVGIDTAYLYQNYPTSITESFGSQNITYDPSKTNPNNFLGLGVNAGYRYGEHYGMEFGFIQYQQKTETVDNTETTMHPRSFYAEARGYYPIHENLELVGIFGVGIFSLGQADVTDTTTNSSSTISSDSDLSPRFGLGLAYHFNDSWGARLEGVYSAIDSHYTENAITARLGVFYMLDAA
jgi:opacity protein-like surface antigen